MAIVAATSVRKTVGDPNAEYLSMIGTWRKNRAIAYGEDAAKLYDEYIDTIDFENLLVPFSPNMSQSQFDFLKAEAELPGIVAEYMQVLRGALLRKDPVLQLPEVVPADALDWIKHCFGDDGSSLTAFLTEALSEELITQRAWVYIDYPEVSDETHSKLTDADYRNMYKPYPVLWPAETVINWTAGKSVSGQTILTRVITRHYHEEYETEPGSQYEFHPRLVEVIKVHEIVNGAYQVRIFESDANTDAMVQDGSKINKPDQTTPAFKLTKTLSNIRMNNKPLSFIPAWPLNGSINVVRPVLTPLIDKEIALYNKLTRRNHLLYGAATYTPYVTSDMSDDDFERITGAGLGSWLKADKDAKFGVLTAPVEALGSLQTAIQDNIEEMAKLGVRMLSQERAESGVALNLRNASQTAKLGSLNTSISTTMCSIITFMINWRYNLDIADKDVTFNLSEDFQPSAIGEVWLKLVTEWYQEKLVPRSIFLNVLRKNDILPQDYDDDEGVKEINADKLVKDPMDIPDPNSFGNSQV